jgi:hypothetical protein
MKITKFGILLLSIYAIHRAIVGQVIYIYTVHSQTTHISLCATPETIYVYTRTQHPEITVQIFRIKILNEGKMLEET